MNTTKTDLTKNQRRLVEWMQRLNFGRIENLPVRNGEPVFDPPPRVIREVKFGGENRPRPETAKPDFCLKAEVVDLFEHLKEVGDGVITRLEIQRGLPFRMAIEEAVA
jgi:hypothetical protein